ncbi:hypothetical protein BV898_00094 [Hypsibius exemplaris]|uniref:PWWP domain-containing protein n=1 Tax=Hypsibius exemplaris TaxID=2072580 RepID=A0A1W0XF07_HYPEX|nr:hypothetical protein BV898_00094 [Hypsibius exemplaris]
MASTPGTSTKKWAPKIQNGQVVWCRIAGYLFWPATVLGPDLCKNLYKKKIKDRNLKTRDVPAARRHKQIFCRQSNQIPRQITCAHHRFTQVGDILIGGEAETVFGLHQRLYGPGWWSEGGRYLSLILSPMEKQELLVILASCQQK